MPSQTLQVRGAGDRHHNHQHITAVSHFGTFGTQPSASAHAAKQGTQTPTNITSKPPGSHKAKGLSKVTPNFPAPPCPSFGEHLGMTDLPWLLNHISTWEGSSYFQARYRSSALRRKQKSAICEVRDEDQEFSWYGTSQHTTRYRQAS